MACPPNQIFSCLHTRVKPLTKDVNIEKLKGLCLWCLNAFPKMLVHSDGGREFGSSELGLCFMGLHPCAHLLVLLPSLWMRLCVDSPCFGSRGILYVAGRLQHSIAFICVPSQMCSLHVSLLQLVLKAIYYKSTTPNE